MENYSERNAASDVKQEIIRLKKEGMEGLVLDLRNNGGGSLKTVVDIAGLFIEKGPIVQIKSKQDGKEILEDKDPSILWDGPLVILVNELSASASEILAAAMQDYKRAIIIGSKQTYGKGTVQNVIDLNQTVRSNEYGDLGALKLTTQKFYRVDGGSMTIFAKDYTNRIMSGNWATIFLIANILITIIPIAIITWVLYLLFKQTYKKYLAANIVLGFSFVLIWGIVAWMINRDMNSNAFIVSYPTIEQQVMDEATGKQAIDKKTNLPLFTYTPVTESTQVLPTDKIVEQEITIIEPLQLNVADEIAIMDVDQRGNFIYLDATKQTKIKSALKSGEESTIINARITNIKENEIEIPATWFLILNSLFIIIFAPLFSKWWESKYNPSGSVKYGLGLILLGIGFAALAFGSLGIESGSLVASVSIIWLILAFLFHTLGELCLSPVALSYISKLVPGRMIAMMFGIWYIAIAIGNKIAGTMGGNIDAITEQYDMTTFFLVFTFIPIGLGVVAILLNPLLKKLMHGVR